MLANEEEISEVVSDRLTENIRASREQIWDSRELVVLREDAPVSIGPKEARFRELNPEPLIEFCRELGFRSIVEDLESDLDYTPGWDETTVEYEWVSCEEMAQVEPDRIEGIYLHLENNSTSVMEVDEFVLVMVSENEVLLTEDDFSGVLNAPLQDVLRTIADADVYSYDQKRLQLLARRTGVPVSDEVETRDLKLVSYLTDPDQDHELDEVLSREAGTSVPDFESDWPREELGNWLARRMVLLGELHDEFYEELEERSQVSVLKELELPLTTILACMEQNGIAVDDQLLEDLSDEIAGTLTELRHRAHELAGREFNLNSPKQLREILFEELDLPVQSKTDSGKASTNADTLEVLQDHHELPEVILEYRKYNKVDSTYLSPLVETMNEQTGKIHTEFHQTVASTGRLSSSNPNLQNIPIREEFGRQVREAFVASDEEYVLLAADYSQIELRLLAHMSQDEALLETFREGKDIHTLAAAEILEKDSGDVDEDDRRIAKVVNYGIAYGLSAHGLSRDLDISRDEAQNYIDRYFERYPGVKSYLDQTIERASEQGYVETLSGRRRYIPELRSSDYYQQQFAERAAVNAPIQGTAADLMKKAMIDLYPHLDDFNCNLLLQVHDELVLEVHRAEVDSLREVLEDKMVNALNLDAPVTVEVKTGTNWAEVSK
jgi:DNA polymerase-1